MRRNPLLSLVILPLFVFGTYVAPCEGADTASGTAIVAIRTPEMIVVAADSRAIHKKDEPDPKPFCKIRKVNDAFVTAYGLYDETGTGFDLWSIIWFSTIGHTKLSDKIRSFEVHVEAPLKSALERIRKEEPSEFKKRCIERPPLGVMFFGVEDETLKLVSCQYRVLLPLLSESPIGLMTTRRDCPGLDCLDGNIGFLATHSESDLDEFRSSFNSEVRKGNVVDFARKFIQMAIDKDSVTFGPPIDIISVTKDGANWVQVKEECQ